MFSRGRRDRGPEEEEGTQHPGEDAAPQVRGVPPRLPPPPEASPARPLSWRGGFGSRRGHQGRSHNVLAGFQGQDWRVSRRFMTAASSRFPEVFFPVGPLPFSGAGFKTTQKAGGVCSAIRSLSLSVAAQGYVHSSTPRPPASRPKGTSAGVGRKPREDGRVGNSLDAGGKAGQRERGTGGRRVSPGAGGQQAPAELCARRA